MSMANESIPTETCVKQDVMTDFLSAVSLGQLMNIAGRQMEEILKATVAATGLTPDHIVILGAVERMPGNGQSFYARLLGINDATFGRYVIRLAKDNLLRRKRSSDDRRLVALYPTREGTDMIQRVRANLMPCNEQIDARFDEGDAQRLRELLRDFMISYMHDPITMPAAVPIIPAEV